MLVRPVSMEGRRIKLIALFPKCSRRLMDDRGLLVCSSRTFVGDAAPFSMLERNARDHGTIVRSWRGPCWGNPKDAARTVRSLERQVAGSKPLDI